MSIQIKLFTLINNKITQQQELTISLEKTIYDLKKEILSIMNWTEFNDVEINNISERVYKDYGMLFFDKGFLPKNIDNFKLGRFTIENRCFSFLIKGIYVKKDNSMPKIAPKNLFSKYKTNYEDVNNTTQSSFNYDEEEFPPLS